MTATGEITVVGAAWGLNLESAFARRRRLRALRRAAAARTRRAELADLLRTRAELEAQQRDLERLVAFHDLYRGR